MNTEATTGEYMLLFRGTQWDKGLSPQELQQVMDKVTAWAEGLQGQGKARVGQPLGAQGRIVSVEIARSNPILEYDVTIEVRPVLAECPVFQRARSKLLSEAVA